MAFIEIEKRNGATYLTLNDPARRNLLSNALCLELIAAVAQANADQQTRAIVIRAQGKAFCAGADLEDLKAAADGDLAAVRNVYDAFLAVANSPLPTVALVAGPAVGAGMNLALACDMRIVGESASFDTRFLQIGLHPGGGHAWMLQRAVGWQQAARLLLFGQVVRGAQAVAIGLAAHCTADANVETAADDLLRNLLLTPRELLLRTKQTMRLSATESHQRSYEHETHEQMWSLHQPAFKQLVEKLQSKLTGR